MADIQLASKFFQIRDFTRVVQIGCGGTGSLLVPHVARAIASIEERKIEYILIDGDKVEDKNIKRQNFIANDIGQFKSDVLAKRYSLALGVNIGSMPEYITRSNKIPSTGCYSILVGCVDNNKTRKLIHDKFLSECFVWVDSGNELLGGQVFISGIIYNDRGPTGLTCDIMTDHPEMYKSTDKLPTELSCAEHVNSGEQSLGVNLTASTILFNVVNSFMRRQKVPYYEVDYTAKNSFKKKRLDDRGV